MGKVFYSHIYQDIPHLEARVDIDNSYKESSLNLHPSQDLMNQAYKVQEWKSPCNLLKICEICPDFGGNLNLDIEKCLKNGF